MQYEESGKKVNKSTAKNAQLSALKGVKTSTIVMALVRRHKFALVSVYAVIITVLYAMPFLPGEIASLITR